MNQQHVKEKLREHKHLEKYPKLTPWVGQNYGMLSKRLLIIGESHYLPKGVVCHQNEEDW